MKMKGGVSLHWNLGSDLWYDIWMDEQTDRGFDNWTIVWERLLNEYRWTNRQTC